MGDGGSLTEKATLPYSFTECRVAAGKTSRWRMPSTQPSRGVRHDSRSDHQTLRSEGCIRMTQTEKLILEALGVLLESTDRGHPDTCGIWRRRDPIEADCDCRVGRALYMRYRIAEATK